MQSYSTDIVVSGSGDFGQLCASGHVRVDSVHYAMGATPGVALISIPDLRPQAMMSQNFALNSVNIHAFGMLIFSGRIWEAKFNESANESEVDIIASDRRVELGVNAIGDPRLTDQWERIGWNVIFNRNNKPNNLDGEIVNFSDDAEYWTINDIIEYIGKKYISNSLFSSVGWHENEFASAYGSDSNPGEVDITGMTISQALDSMVNRLGSASWTIDYPTNRIRMVSSAAYNSTKYIYYAVNNSQPTWDTATQWSVTQDAKVARNRSVAISGNAQSEHTLSLRRGGLERDSKWNSGIYVERIVPADYSISPSPEDDGGVIPIGGSAPGTIPIGGEEDPAAAIIEKIKTRNLRSLPWGTKLISRRNIEGDGYVTSEQYAENPNIGSDVMDRECIWVLDASNRRMRLIAGYDISYDPPAIYLEDVIVAVDSNGTELEIQLSETDFSEAEGVWDIQMTTAVRHDINAYGMSRHADGWSGINIDLASYSEHTDIAPLVRLNSLVPFLDVDDSAFVMQAGEEAFFNPINELDEIASNNLGSFKMVHSELTASLPVPQLVNIGDRIIFQPLGGGNGIIGEPVICTCVDHYFDVEQKTVVRAENQMGAAQHKMRPMSQRNLGYWRHSSKIKLLEKQAYSNRRFAENQLEMIRQAVEQFKRDRDEAAKDRAERMKGSK